MCPLTCQNNTAQVCPEICIPGCFCKDGFVRKSVDGPCILVEHCKNVPKCGDNEEFKGCGTLCPPTCENPKPKFCPYMCVEGCVCKEGFIRNAEGGVCIPTDSCLEVCKENEVYNDCGTLCPGTCSEPVKSCNKMCASGCFCQEGYILDNESQECIKIEECPNVIL
ncbi:zonadhesin, partial [Asbolus verrucosus]